MSAGLVVVDSEQAHEHVVLDVAAHVERVLQIVSRGLMVEPHAHCEHAVERADDIIDVPQHLVHLLDREIIEDAGGVLIIGERTEIVVGVQVLAGQLHHGDSPSE